MPRALLMLLYLKFRGAIRRALRVQGNPKRLILLVVGLVALSLWLGPAIFLAAASKNQPSDFIEVFGPLLLAAFTLFSILAASGDSAIAFQPAEVDMLFPGPFTRRQLLGYKLLNGMVASLLGAVVFTVFFRRHAHSWSAVFVGMVLTLWFVQFLGTALALIKQLIGEMAYTRVRRVLLGAVVIGASVAAAMGLQQQSFENLPQLARQIGDSPAGDILLAPFRVYTSIIASPTLEAGARWVGIGVAIDALLAFVVLRLDTNYIEASIRASERHAERIRRARSGNMFAAPNGSGKSMRSRRLTGLPWLGGAAPIVWRQSTTLRRSGRKWAIQVLFVLAIAGVFLGSMSRIESQDAGLGIGAGVLGYLTIILTAMLRFDFRADLDHIETLKALPLTPRAVAFGELVLPCMLLCAIQAMLIAAAAWVLRWPTVAIVSAFVAMPVVNLLLLGIENLLFLMFPARLNNRGVADFSLIGRQMLLFMGKILIVGVVAAAAIGASFGMYALTEKTVASLIAAWVVVAIGAVGAVLGVGRAFRAFDVSSDMPPA